MKKELIKISRLSKIYGKDEVISSLTFSIYENEIVAILGENGAGKSTLLSVLATIITPTSGSVRYKLNECWLDAQRSGKEIRKYIGFIFQDCLLDEDLTVYQNLDIHALLYSLDKKKRREMIMNSIKIVGLEKYLHKKTKVLSGGLKKRLEIARGLLNKPKILFVDEPTLGLDPAASLRIHKHILDLKKNQKITIILTTNSISEAEKLADRIIILKQGRIKYDKRVSSMNNKRVYFEVLKLLR